MYVVRNIWHIWLIIIVFITPLDLFEQLLSLGFWVFIRRLGCRYGLRSVLRNDSLNVIHELIGHLADHLFFVSFEFKLIKASFCRCWETLLASICLRHGLFFIFFVLSWLNDIFSFFSDEIVKVTTLQLTRFEFSHNFVSNFILFLFDHDWPVLCGVESAFSLQIVLWSYVFDHLL